MKKKIHSIHTHHTQLLTNDAPFAFVEAYKTLRTNLQFASINNNYKKIIVTSSLPGEGKSTVAINLALSLQSDGNHVLLVEADLRKPAVQRYLHLGRVGNVGLSNLLAKKEKLQEALILLSDSELSVILAGPVPPNPTEMIGSPNMKELIDTLEKSYDYIVFDTPPVSVVTDAAVLSKWCDGVILVIKQKFTDKQSALLAKDNLMKVGANIIGCVLTDFKASQSKHSYTYYNYKYKYSYDSHEKN